MSKTALSEEVMRDSLLDIRLPTEPAVAFYADLLLAAGLGGAVALVLVGVVRLVSRRRTGTVQANLQDRIIALRALPDDMRRIGFLRLLKEIAPQHYATLRPRLYRQDAEVDPEEEVQRRVRAG